MPATKTMNAYELKQIIFRVLNRIAPEADLSKLNPNENIQSALDIDSFDFLNVLIGLSEEIGVEVPEADYGQVATLQGLTSYLLAHL